MFSYRREILSAQANLIRIMQTANNKWIADTPYWNGTVTTMPSNGRILATTLTSYATQVNALSSSSKMVHYQQVMYYTAKLTQLYANYSIGAYGQLNTTALTLGQINYRPVP